MSTSLFSPFYSKQSSLDKWDFHGPRRDGLNNKGGSWNWLKGSTRTNHTGPSAGQSHGYVYIESSSPTRAGDKFTMTTKDVFNAKDYELNISYYYNSNTDTPCTLEVFGWDGFKWRLEDKLVPEIYDLKDEWSQRFFKIEDYNNTDCKLRFVVTTGESGKTYRKDFAIDTVQITTGESDVDDFVNYFDTKEIYKRKKGGRVFNGKGKSNINSILTEFKNKLKNFDFKKYNGRVVVVENENIIHVYNENDKDT